MSIKRICLLFYHRYVCYMIVLLVKLLDDKSSISTDFYYDHRSLIVETEYFGMIIKLKYTLNPKPFHLTQYSHSLELPFFVFSHRLILIRFSSSVPPPSSLFCPFRSCLPPCGIAVIFYSLVVIGILQISI